MFFCFLIPFYKLKLTLKNKGDKLLPFEANLPSRSKTREFSVLNEKGGLAYKNNRFWAVNDV